MSKIAVVTGAGSGIGRFVTINLVSEGYTVYAVGRTLSKLEETAKLCNDVGKVIPLIIDVSDKNSVYKGFKQIEQVDVMVANAGICKQASLFDEDADEVWEQIMATNTDAVWYMFRALADKLNKNARTVVVSSGLGKLGRPGYGAYTASKHAVLGLVKCFSKELATRGITVNAVCPGWVDTEMAAADLIKTAETENSTPEKIKEQAISNIPIGRFVKPEEVASLIGWLLSEQAGAVTGQAYNISGGEFFA